MYAAILGFVIGAVLYILLGIGIEVNSGYLEACRIMRGFIGIGLGMLFSSFATMVLYRKYPRLRTIKQHKTPPPTVV